MFTVELKVNGAMIGHIHGVNKGLHPEGKGETIYEYEYYDVEERDLIKGKVFHKKGDGIKHLIRLILDDI
jgi:hypothetical protein